MIDYVVIGHICADLQPDGSTRLGGTALFAALTAHRLGLRTAIVTACAPDFDLSALPEGVQIFRQPSPETTIFENRYHASGRTQLLHARAETIDLRYVPPEWLDAPIVHIAPIIQEVPDTVAALFPQALLGVTPQGWIRSVQPDKIVTTAPEDLLTLPLTGVRIVILSEEDVQYDEPLVERLAQRIPLVVLTRAERGATVFVSGASTDVAAFPAEVVDPTGAGDVFAAAFFMALQQGQLPVAAARWACAAAAYAIEGPGISTLPTTEQVEERFKLL
ncbi:MAG TPA: PfkB family carbohydrate kinase [Herpetosiphonaceae bacterium]